MKVLIGCDVDPLLPPHLTRRTDADIWTPLDRIPRLVEALGSNLPPVTWLIRADETIRFCTGEYASGYTSRQRMWSQLGDRGHEFGWHMHLLDWDETAGSFVFEPKPNWLRAAYEELNRHFDVRATRTGWDYGSDFLFGELDELGIELDFSALPGGRAWYRLGTEKFVVDWLRAPLGAYRPSRADYQQPGPSPLSLLELPIAQFRNSALGGAMRLAWRIRHGCLSARGLFHKTKLITDRWKTLPSTRTEVWAFYFHPEDLTPEGITNFVTNVNRLCQLPALEFLTASRALTTIRSRRSD